MCSSSKRVVALPAVSCSLLQQQMGSGGRPTGEGEESGRSGIAASAAASAAFLLGLFFGFCGPPKLRAASRKRTR
eukprot:11347183-Alexandrium_andersonii.AAC.1